MARSRTLVAGLLLLAAMIVLAACSTGEKRTEFLGVGDDDATQQESDGAEGEGDQGEEVSPPTTFDWDKALDEGDPIALGEAQVGDCLNEYSWIQDGEGQDLIFEVPCDIPHDKEVFMIDVFPGDASVPYPGEEFMGNYASQVCYLNFADFIGESYELSAYSIDHTYPPRANYEDGLYRDITCMVAGDGRTIGSAIGSNK